MRRRLLILGLAVPIAVPVLYLGTAASADPKPVEFTDARLKVEINATDGDAGLQIFLDGEAWNTMELLDPRGNPIVDVDVTGRAENYGLTELFSESSEPPFTEFPLEQFKELFPEGTYTFTGTTIDGAPMTGTATLTHDFPDGPEILSPAADSKVPLTKWWCSGRRSPIPPESTSLATRCSSFRRNRCCGSSAQTCRRPPPSCLSPPSSCSRAPNTRSRCSR